MARNFEPWMLDNENYGNYDFIEYPLWFVYNEADTEDNGRFDRVIVPITNDEQLKIIHELHNLWYNNNWSSEFQNHVIEGNDEWNEDIFNFIVRATYQRDTEDIPQKAIDALELGKIYDETYYIANCYVDTTCFGGAAVDDVFARLEDFTAILRQCGRDKNNQQVSDVYNTIAHMALFGGLL